jgi:hypothetical protein
MLGMLGHVSTAAAHGFGQRYDLPIPLSLYALGAAAAVALSFGAIGLFAGRIPGRYSYPHLNLLGMRLGRWLVHPGVLLALQLGSVGLFILLILTGLFGFQHPERNLAPTLVWIIWWVGFAYISALLGNLWTLLNPWKILFGWAEALYRSFVPGAALARHWPYPRALGAWPGVVLFLCFAWVELVFKDAPLPATLATLALLYSAVTWLGMFLFGKDVWLRYGEIFSLVFGLLARFAPTEVRVVDQRVCQTCPLDCCRDHGLCVDCYACFERAEGTQRQWNLRPYAAGLARHEPVPVADMVFTLILLATVTFDGFLATPLWADMQSTLQGLLSPVGNAPLVLSKTIGFVLCPMLFLAIYMLIGLLMALGSGGRYSGVTMAQFFALTLVPIAIAYHIAHYLSFLLIEGQRIIPLASDPFGVGWDLLHTVDYQINIAIMSARFSWYTAVITIVVGHIIAVYLAHLVALRLLGDQALARRSQYPMLVLMIGYTMASLWMLAQPIMAG